MSEQLELGVPTSATEVPLAEVLDDATSGFASGKKDSVGTVQVRMNNVKTDGSWDWSSIRRVPATAKQLSRYSLRPGDVLFNSTNSPKLVGKTAVFAGMEEPVLFSNHFIRLRVNPSKADPSYVTRWLVRQWQGRRFEQMCTQWVNQASVRREDLLALEVPLPPLEEQRRIAAILDKADAIRRKRQQAIDLTDQLLRSAFLDMFGDPVKRPGITEVPEGWTYETIADVVASEKYSCVGGPFGSDLTAKDYVDAPGVPVIRGGDLATDDAIMCEDQFVFVSSEKARALSRNMAYRGDVVISQRGARLAGQVALIPADSVFERYVVSQSQMKVTLDPERMLPMYLIAFMRSAKGVREMEARTISTGVPHINLGILKRFPVPVPPMELQRKYVSVWGRVHHLRTSHLRGQRQAEDLFGSLVHRAFRGEL